MKKCIYLILLMSSVIGMYAQPLIELEVYATDFDEPVDIANAGDERLFIVERDGYIRIIEGDGTVLGEDFLDINAIVESGSSEQGLLGLAFHPDYAINGYFYVYYIDNDDNTVVARYSVDPFDLNNADEDSELIIFTVEQPFWNHNGGCIKFGPDGYLYIALGDGGSAGDPGNRAQNPENKLGKMHRLDVDTAEPFAIPDDNPYYGSTDTLETIWSSGLRNPWRFTFDRLTGDMWIADVGQNLWEEVNFEPAGMGGANYGWRCYEGNHSFSLGGCEGEEFYTFPFYEYDHSFSLGGYAVTGGFVYRGEEFPGIVGYYLFADYVSGNWWHTYRDEDGEFITTFLDDIQENISSFGEDIYGEMYCADMSSGIIYRITDVCGDFDISVNATDFYCDEIPGTATVEIFAGESPFNILWSTGDTEGEVTGLSAGEHTVTVTDDLGCMRVQTIVVNDLEPAPAIVSFDDISNSISVSEGVAWQWFINGNPIEGASDSILEVLVSGIYTVAITYENSCIVTSEEFDLDLVPVTDLLKYSILLFPNPAVDILTISGPEQIEITAFRLYSLQGNLVYSQNSNFNKSNFNVDISALTSGLYYAVLNTTEGTGAYQIEIIH